MPKKFERRQNAKKTEEKSTEAEDHWEENDKNVKKKQQRKEESMKKRELQMARKAETKKLLEEETNRLKSAKVSTQKLTRCQIGTNLRPVKKDTVKNDVLTENVNRRDDEAAARSVEEAISLLQTSEKDKHPEKRRKAAFSSFEARRLEELKTEHPQMRYSQLKEVVFKEWQKSSENPMNQV